MNRDEQRRQRVEDIFSTLQLDTRIISLVHTINAESNKNPYHNFQHLLTVCIRAYEGALFYNLTKHEQQALVISGLCHDICYTIGATEYINISKAVSELKNIYPQCSLSPILIKATEFPHNKVKTLPEQIIQDADLMQSLEPDCEKFFNGLTMEWNNGQKADPRFPGEKAYNTKWAKHLYNKKFGENIERTTDTEYTTVIDIEAS